MINKCFIPFPELETDRLILRQIGTDQRDPLFEILSDPEVARYDYFEPLSSVDEAVRFIRRYHEELDDMEEITWGLYQKETDELIGTCCLGDFCDEARRAEIGYALNRRFWNRGFATEAVKAVIAFGFKSMDLNRIETTITPGNDASVKVLKKLDFTLEGIVRERDLIKGKLEDGIIMSMLRREYR